MPTYGTPETAKNYPVSPEKKALDVKFDGYLAARSALTETCDHHIVPCTHELTMSKVAGVYAAHLIIRCDPPVSAADFGVRCTRCDSRATSNVAQRCPLCAHGTKELKAPQEKIGEPNPLFDYFDEGSMRFGNALYLIGCTNDACPFKAAGYYEDR